MRQDNLINQINDGFLHHLIAEIKDIEGQSLGQFVYLNWEIDSYCPNKTTIRLTFENESGDVMLDSPGIQISHGSSENFVRAYTALLQLIDRRAPMYNLCMKEIMALRQSIASLEELACVDHQSPSPLMM